MTRSGALLIACFVLAIPVCLAQADGPSTQPSGDALHKGTEAMQAGKFADAEKWFSAAVKVNPENADARMELGVAELRLGKAKEATEDLRDAITRNPQIPGANLFLGIAYAQMHLLNESIDALSREIELNPKNAQAQMWLGVVELQAGHPEKATDPLDRAAELEPNNLNILDYRGKAHNDVAYESYARMATIDPHSWHVHKVQAEFYGHEKQYKLAVAEYLEAIKAAPGNSDLYEELGDAYRQAGSLDLAQHAYAKELELSPNNPIAMYNLGQIDIETGNAEKGLQLLRTVTVNYQNSPTTYFYLGLGEFETGDTDGSAATMEKALGMHPDPNLTPRIEYELSRIYRKLGRIADSEKAIQEYTRLKAQNAKQNSDAEKNAAEGPGATNSAAPQLQDKN
jgi:tetratricopeptide (TPR) repeat protein